MDSEPMAFQNGVSEFENELANENARTGGKSLQRDGHVVARCRNARDRTESKRFCNSRWHIKSRFQGGVAATPAIAGHRTPYYFRFSGLSGFRSLGTNCPSSRINSSSNQ